MYEYKREDVFQLAIILNAETKQKGDELHFKFCPYCNGGGHDKSTFAVNLATGAFNCLRNSCGKQGHFVELARDFDFRLVDENKSSYKTLPQKKIKVKPKAVEYLESRGISAAIAEKYNITTQTENESVLVFPFYDENNVLTFVKYRNTKQKKGERGNKEWCEKDTKPILFGMAQCEDFSILHVCEGQIDSLSLATCGIKNSVSVPTGAMGFTWLTHCWDWINKFEKVVVFGDFEKGKMSLIEKLQTSLSCKVYAVREKDYLHEKDANAILTKYGKQAVLEAVNNAEIQEVDSVKRLSLVKSVDMMSLPKIKTGILPIDRAIGGLYFGQVILLTGKRGNGKSTFMSQIVAEAIEQNFSVFVYSGELPDYHFKNWLDLQIAGLKNLDEIMNEYGDVKYILKKEVSEVINRWYHDKAFIFDNFAVDDKDFEGILKVIEKSIQRYNIKLICIDNLMTALDDDPKSDIYRQQSVFVKSLKKIAKKYDVAVVLVAHPRKSGNTSNNDTVSGSADITNAVDVVMSYEKSSDKEEYDSEVIVTKNRLTGKLLVDADSAKLIYSNACKRIKTLDSQEDKEYSCFKGSEIVEDFSGLLF